ncbi:unnamed protein product [Anisakis simplex]|uniref:C2H2-type domain-containing protein n=1 Tax=Anisakis simplex TaxID=6269 RepID=A0A0M3JR42_ANISI|nr:unnamed protein product [Anisakis simplex]
MFCNSTQPIEVITLSDSDDDNITSDLVHPDATSYHNQSVPSSSAPTATASISIVHERPLSPSAFLPKPSNYPQKAPSQRSSSVVSFNSHLLAAAHKPTTITNNTDNSASQHIISLKRRLPCWSSASSLKYGQDTNLVGPKRAASASLRNEPRSFSPSTLQNSSLNALKILQQSFSSANAQLLSSNPKYTCLIRGNVDNSNPTNGSSYQILPAAQPISCNVTNTPPPTHSIHHPYQPNHPLSMLSKNNTPYSNTPPLKNKAIPSLTTKSYNNNNHSLSSSTFSISSKPAWASASSTMILASYCYESFDPKAPPFEPQTFSAKFKCSYGSCRKVLSNNVSLMVHVWSHLIYDSDNGDNDKSDSEHDSDDDCVTKRGQSLTFTCPECLESFGTSHLMQIHYDQVHSEEPADDTCFVCESVVEPVRSLLDSLDNLSFHSFFIRSFVCRCSSNKLYRVGRFCGVIVLEMQVIHAEMHGDDDAPYHCRKCRFRTSIRHNLIQHFIRFHSNTRSLLCPFCLASFHVPSSSSHSTVVTNKSFVDHMRSHAVAKSKKCPNCALRFFRDADRRAHKKDHTKKNPKWISKQCTKHRLQTKLKGRKVWSSAVKRCCLECDEVVNDIVEHTRQMRTCARCDYATACDTEYMHHKNIKCNIVRSGFTRARLLRHCVTCPKCGRKSANAIEIFEHLSKCSDGHALVHEAEFKEANEFDAQQERDEVSRCLIPENFLPFSSVSVEHFSLQQPRCSRGLAVANQSLNVKKLGYYRDPWEINDISDQLEAETSDEHDGNKGNGDRRFGVAKKHFVSIEMEALLEQLNDVLQCMDT